MCFAALIWQQITRKDCFRDEYISLLINCLEHLRPDMVIHRITGDGPKDLLIAPLWANRKREVLNMLHHRMKEEQSYQGRLFSH